MTKSSQDGWGPSQRSTWINLDWESAKLTRVDHDWRSTWVGSNRRSDWVGSS